MILTMQRTLMMVSLGLSVLILTSCGSGENAESGAGDNQTSGVTPKTHEGPYAVGDTYDDGEFAATYLGLAELSLGKYSQWSDGKCYAFLVNVTRHTDLQNSGGTDKFSPATKGVLTGNRETERDMTGVDCNTKPLGALNYLRTHDAKLHVGESAKVWTGAIHVPAADAGAFEGIVLYGSSDLFEPEVTVSAIAKDE